MEQVWPILQNPFTWGLGLGLLIALFAWRSGASKNSTLKTEIKRLKEDLRELQNHLNTHLKIAATGNAQLQRDLETIKAQNENLRVSVATLQQKPGRAEIRQLQVVEAAATRMRERAPGFAAAWEQAIREANSEVEQAEGGLGRLIRKVLPGTSGTTSAAPDDRHDRKPLLTEKGE